MRAKTKIINAIAVVISDIHFNLNNLELASASLRAARKKAADLNLPLYIAGDLTDTKAVIRGEVANRLLTIFNEHPSPKYTKILVGNHDLINEKGKENAINFLNLLPSVEVIQEPRKDTQTGVLLIPYQPAGSSVWTTWLPEYQKGHTVVMHQGVTGAFLGDYVVDHSAIDSKLLEGFNVISGHYHRHQTVGPVSYIGSPYTMSFGEANDGPKGFLILNSAGGYERVILDNIRRHIVLQLTTAQLKSCSIQARLDDLVWLKVSGPSSDLDSIDKKQLGEDLLGHSNYKLDRIYSEVIVPGAVDPKASSADLLDSLIDSTEEADHFKVFLKSLWRDIV